MSKLMDFFMPSLILAAVLLFPCVSRSQTAINDAAENRVIAIGFVGGLRSPEDINQGVVQIASRLKGMNCPGLEVSAYSHFHWRRAYDRILGSIDSDRDGKLSEAELSRAPKVIIFGHSLGGWAVLKLARRLEKARVPVELTVQIDSVGIGDEMVPANVKFAMNFYQRNQWPLRGEKKIMARNAGSTDVIGNVLIQHVRHESLARATEISDFIAGKVRVFCPVDNRFAGKLARLKKDRLRIAARRVRTVAYGKIARRATMTGA